MNSLKKINEILNNDGVIAFVTDTVWGIGCLPTSEKAVQKIYEHYNKRLYRRSENEACSLSFA